MAVMYLYPRKQKRIFQLILIIIVVFWVLTYLSHRLQYLEPSPQQQQLSPVLFVTANKTSVHNDSTILDCVITVQYSNIRSASLFVNGLFEYYFHYKFSSEHCIREPLPLPTREMNIITYTNHTIYINPQREYCLRPWPEDKTPVIAYNYYNEKTYGNTMYLPLLFRYDIGHFTDDILPMLNNYEYTPSFEQRQFLFSAVMSMQTGNRSQYQSYFEQLGEMYREKAFIHLIDFWIGNNRKRKGMRNATQYLQRRRYWETLQNSKFVINMEGVNAESFRIWETLAANAIPIVAINTRRYVNHSCMNALDGFLLHSNDNNVSDMNINATFFKNNFVFSKHSYESEWFYFDRRDGFDVNKLNDLYAAHQFSPFIVLDNWWDLNMFLKFVDDYDDNVKAIRFWNTFQEYANAWIAQYVEFKMMQLSSIIISHI
eukprot:945447_1